MTEAEKKRFEIRDTPEKGQGLFARVPFKKGDFIIEYVGIPLDTDYADTLHTRYLFDLENGTTIDGSPLSNTARYINHSCDPNCEAFLEDAHIMIYAFKPIKVGDELSFDYGSDYYDEFIKPYGCRCTAKKHLG